MSIISLTWDEVDGATGRRSDGHIGPKGAPEVNRQPSFLWPLRSTAQAFLPSRKQGVDASKAGGASPIQTIRKAEAEALMRV
eukprot:626612-Pyramimonas_sp.AAC.1